LPSTATDYEISDAIEDFNGVDLSDGKAHDGVEYGADPQNPEHLISPTMTSTPSAPSPDVNSGTKRYFVSDDSYAGQYSDVCSVNVATGKVLFKAIGTCSLFVFITSNGKYKSATSPAITITLATSCGDLEPRTNPQLGSAEGNVGVTSPGTFGPECEVKGTTTINSWAYAGGPAFTDPSSNNAFVSATPGDIPYIELAQYCQPRAAGNGAFVGAPAGSIKLTDWNYVWAWVKVSFEDGSSRFYYTDNYLAAPTFSDCYTNNFNANDGVNGIISSVQAFAGETLVTPIPTRTGYGLIGWSTDPEATTASPVVGLVSGGPYFAVWSENAPTPITVAMDNKTIVVGDALPTFTSNQDANITNLVAAVYESTDTSFTNALTFDALVAGTQYVIHYVSATPNAGFLISIGTDGTLTVNNVTPPAPPA
jgi:hypothetical protein